MKKNLIASTLFILVIITTGCGNKLSQKNRDPDLELLSEIEALLEDEKTLEAEILELEMYELNTTLSEQEKLEEAFEKTMTEETDFEQKINELEHLDF